MKLFNKYRIQVAPEFARLLEANGLTSFDAIMALPVQASQVTRRFPGRLTARLELKGERATAVYLKRYERNYLSFFRLFLRLIRWPSARDEAQREWEALKSLRAKNIAVPVPVAIGQQKVLGVVVRSFVMTEEIHGGIRASTLWPQIAPAERKALVLELADFARAFHATGHVHKDFYLLHFHVVRKTGNRSLHLLDLQRAARPRFFYERWLIKDLGALAFSALNAGVSTAALIAFYKRYCAIERIN